MSVENIVNLRLVDLKLLEDEEGKIVDDKILLVFTAVIDKNLFSILDMKNGEVEARLFTK